MTDYSILSGAEFQREVGDDPRKWAEAMFERYERRRAILIDSAQTDESTVAFFERWIADAMQAARAATPPVVVTYDKDGNIRDATDDERTIAAAPRKE